MTALRQRDEWDNVQAGLVLGDVLAASRGDDPLAARIAALHTHTVGVDTIADLLDVSVGRVATLLDEQGTTIQRTYHHGSELVVESNIEPKYSNPIHVPNPAQNESILRKSHTDGLLYAYRDDANRHIVVLRSDHDRWTKAVPATRYTATTGEHLWTIPDNWRSVETDDGAYEIPETNSRVHLTHAASDTPVIDAYHEVHTVQPPTASRRVKPETR